MNACFDSTSESSSPSEVDGRNDTYVVYTPIAHNALFFTHTMDREGVLGASNAVDIFLVFTSVPLTLFALYQLYAVYGIKSKGASAILLVYNLGALVFNVQASLGYNSQSISFNEYATQSNIGLLLLTGGAILAWGHCGWKTKELYLLLKTLVFAILIFPVLRFSSPENFAWLFSWLAEQNFLTQILTKTLAMTALKEYILFVQITFATSFIKADHKYTWLLVCVHSTQIPFLARFLQFTSPNTSSIVAVEVRVGLVAKGSSEGWKEG
jgi:hypothetical protein